MRSVFYRGTGRMITHPEQRKALKGPFEIVRNNEVFIADFLEDTRGRSLYKRGSQDELDCRLNATGDTADRAFGYQIAIDTLTFLSRQISMQKFYEFAFADFVPVMVGEGAFASNILFNRTYSTAEDFEAGNIRQGSNDARLSTAEVGIDGVTQPTMFWAKSIQYTIIEVEQALRANSWDPIMARMAARKKNWDLGLQATSMWGLATDSRFPGLLTNPNFNTDTAIITKYISSMTAAEFATFLAAFLPRYFATNTGSTAMPDTFIMPYVDWLACSQLMAQNVIAAGSGTYVGMNILDYLLMGLKRATQNPNFKILPLAYADKAVNLAARGLNKNYYVLLRQDKESIRMNIPIDFTTLQAGTINNFQFQAVAYGQYTGVIGLRNLETLYFTF